MGGLEPPAVSGSGSAPAALMSLSVAGLNVSSSSCTDAAIMASRLSGNRCQSSGSSSKLFGTVSGCGPGLSIVAGSTLVFASGSGGVGGDGGRHDGCCGGGVGGD